jgi:hypothetical protein
MPVFLVNPYLNVLLVKNILHKPSLNNTYSMFDALNPVYTVTDVRNGNLVNASKNAIWYSSWSISHLSHTNNYTQKNSNTSISFKLSMVDINFINYFFTYHQ